MAEKIEVDPVEWYRLKQAETDLLNTKRDLRAATELLGELATTFKVDLMGLAEGRVSFTSMLAGLGVAAAKMSIGAGPDLKSFMTDERRELIVRLKTILTDELA